MFLYKTLPPPKEISKNILINSIGLEPEAIPLKIGVNVKK
jgi:hypothetical protein